MTPSITRIETFAVPYEMSDVRRGRFGPPVYCPGETCDLTTRAVRIHTDEGVAGGFVGGNAPGFAQLDVVAPNLLGRDALAREAIWTDCKRALRSYDRMGVGPLDIALWDLAGRYYDAPIHRLLGTHRTRLPAYASTYFGDSGSDGGLDSPDAYADFAAVCRDLGYGAFKIHPLDGGDPAVDVETVHAVADRVGEEMRLMHDPVCAYDTWGAALEVGRACDERGFFWYEDPYRDAGSSQHGHRRLAEKLDTPLLQAEMVRGVEAHTDFVDADATDFVRADPIWDGGITGAMKIARIAEGHGLDVEFHLAGPHVRQCMAATRNANYYELGLVGPDSEGVHSEPPVYAGNYADRLDSVDDDGCVEVPDGPGLGVEYDWAYIADAATETRVYE